MSYPKPEGIENTPKQDATTGERFESLKQALSTAKSRPATPKQARSVSARTPMQTKKIDSTAQVTICTPSQKMALNQWKAEKSLTPKRSARPASLTPNRGNSAPKPTTPILHSHKKLIKMHVASARAALRNGNAVEARRQLQEMSAPMADGAANPAVVTLPEYWIARSEIEVEELRWQQAFHFLQEGLNHGAKPVATIRSAASLLLAEIRAFVVVQRQRLVIADSAARSSVCATLRQVVDLLTRVKEHSLAIGTVASEVNDVLILVAKPISLPAKVAAPQPTASLPIITEELVNREAPKDSPGNVTFTAIDLAKAIGKSLALKAAVEEETVSAKAPAVAQPAAYITDSPEVEIEPLDEDMWQSPEAALAESDLGMDTAFNSQPERRRDFTPTRLEPNSPTPPLYTSAFVKPAPVTPRATLDEAAFMSPEQPRIPTDEDMQEAPTTPLGGFRPFPKRRKKSLMMRCPSPYVQSSQPKRVKASREMREARKAKIEQTDQLAAGLDALVDELFEDDVDVMDSTAKADAHGHAFSALPKAFPVTAIPVIDMICGNEVDDDEEEALKGSLMVITPARTTKKEKEMYGSEKKLAAVRRSTRLFQDSTKPLVDIKEPAAFNEVLKTFDYVYSPNPTLLLKKRPTKLLADQMAALTLDEDIAGQEMAADVKQEAADGARYQEVVSMANGKGKRECRTPVVRSARLAKKRKQQQEA